ncbi:hypothetical protein [Bdellovibrio bacteriovorus]|uniref:hypothetical protein n=1 Tax=Bdellovibrio TaxID=958 RepID=UPI0035A83F93
MERLVWSLIFSVLLSGCGLEASIENLDSIASDKDFKQAQRKQPDISQTETVTSASGYQIQGSWNELSQDKHLANGYKIEGVFYE